MVVQFAQDRRGAVALLFGIAVIPLLGIVGAAVDYSRAVEYRTFLHRETDLAALAIASADMPNTETVKTDLRNRALTHFGPANAQNPVQSVTVSSDWTGGELLTVTVSSTYKPSILRSVPGLSDPVTVAVSTDVSRIPAKWQWRLPEITDLSYEAGDYNRISVYCYDETKKNSANKGRRLETLTAISDNGGTSYKNVTMPSCKDGETLSFQLRNVRNSRTNKNNWDNKDAEHYLYFTDTEADPNTRILKNIVTGGREDKNGNITYSDMTNAPILETILCDTKTICQTKKDGGTLPNDNETHNAVTATAGCTEGKYMYYGWEDRPPFPNSGSDKDYDDIRIVVSCPTLVKISDKEVKIVR
jgi:Flp pilus assembly protein TadG